MTNEILPLSFLLPFLVAASQISFSAIASDPIKPIQVKPNATAFQQGGSPNKPVVIGTVEEAGKYFDKEQLARVAEEVDFKNQRLLIFAWRGSGQDQLSYQILESYPEQIRFSLERGRSRDLRSHAKVFALRSNVSWQNPDGTKGSAQPANSDYVKVEIRGKLNSRVVAIGGETTGVTISSTEITFELDFGDNKKLSEKALALHDKTVVAKGTLTRQNGVEIGSRWILKTSSLDEIK